MRLRLILLITAAVTLAFSGCGSTSVDDGGVKKANKSSVESTAVIGNTSDTESARDNSETEENSEPEEELTAVMTIDTTYGGFGEDGNDLGSGSFSAEFEVKKGDVFTEDMGGNWELKKKKFLGRDDDGHKEVIAEIVDINEKGVIVKLEEGNVMLVYGEEEAVGSTFVVCDGINYYHVIKFTK